MSKERTPTYAELRNIVAELTAKRYEWEAKAYFERERGRAEAAVRLLYRLVGRHV